ncbi:NAD(P)H-hydrate dehydratase [Candidatus Fermentibacteria bacterium]|nr:NAD(P)H-hydrate dehydratase [Candidatus Fermentibacteria bacterium]
MKWAVDAAAMRAIDERAIRDMGIPGRILMENAGNAVAEVAVGMAGSGSILILCGPGNNGGDGFVAARLLKERGYPAEIALLAAKVAGDSARNLDLARAIGIPITEIMSETHLASADGMFTGASLVIDALLGTGSRGPPRGLIGAAIQRLETLRSPVLAVDIPTGMDSDTGRADGPVVSASATVTMGLLKTGMLFFPGCTLAGRLTVADIGLPRELLDPPQGGVQILEPGDLASSLPTVPSSAHKGLAGRILVIAGATGMTGAAALCCAAALKAGAGMVYLAIPEHLNTILETMLPEVITIPVPERDGMHCRGTLDAVRSLLDSIDTVVLGPGLGRGAGPADLVKEVLASWRGPLVLDADGLFHLPADLTLSNQAVLTPHIGEMARLAGCSGDSLRADPRGAACREACRRQATVLLKGAPTVVADGKGHTGVNLTGNAGLATGGSGDVLSGAIAGFMAQGAEGYRAAMAGAFVHGLAADCALEEMPHASILPTDVVRLLPKALRMAGFGDRSDPRPWWKR